MIALRLPRWMDAKRGFWWDHFRWILPPHNPKFNLHDILPDTRQIAYLVRQRATSTFRIVVENPHLTNYWILSVKKLISTPIAKRIGIGEDIAYTWSKRSISVRSPSFNSFRVDTFFLFISGV